MHVTLNDIRRHSPCEDGWIKLLKHLGKRRADNEPLALSVIIKSNGLDDALWCLRAALPDHHDAKIRLLVCDIAERALRFVPAGEVRPKDAIETARRFANALATKDDLISAYDAARDAARDAAWAAAGTAAWGAARDVAGTAAWGVAWGAAWAAANAAARAAAGDVARDVARDAAGDVARTAAWGAAGTTAGAAEVAAQETIFRAWLAKHEGGLSNV